MNYQHPLRPKPNHTQQPSIATMYNPLPKIHHKLINGTNYNHRQPRTTTHNHRQKSKLAKNHHTNHHQHSHTMTNPRNPAKLPPRNLATPLKPNFSASFLH